MLNFQRTGNRNDRWSVRSRGKQDGLEEPLVFSALGGDEYLVGEGAVTTCCGHDAELVWCLVFPEPISSLSISRDLPCTLQGAIREHRLESSSSVTVASRSNRTILAVNRDGGEGSYGGIRTTLMALDGGEVQAVMRLQYLKENMRGRVERQVTTAHIKSLPLQRHLAIMQDKITRGEVQDARIIRLHPYCNSSGYVQERWLKYRSALIAIKGTKAPAPVNATIRCKLISDIVTRREYIKLGTAAHLEVFDGDGKCIGCSSLYVH